MEIVMLVLLAATAAVQVYVLTRLPSPHFRSSSGTLRSQPGAAAMAVVVAAVLLGLLGLCTVWTLQGGWRLAMIVWAGSLLFLLAGAALAFNGIRYGTDGFALRDKLGGVHTYRWAGVQGAEALILPRQGRGFDTEIIAVYLPDRTLPLRRTAEGTEQPFLQLLKEKCPGLPDSNPDGRRVYSPWLSLVTAGVLALFLFSLALAGMEEPAGYGWLWIPAVLGAGYLVLIIVAVLRPQSFSTKTRENLLGTEPRRKE